MQDRNTADIAALKTAFRGNETLLKQMRALWFNLPLTETDKETIRSTFANVELRDAVRRKLYSEMGDEAPIGSVPDFWLNIQDDQIVGASRDAIYQIVTSKDQLYKMFQRAIALLGNPNGEKNDISVKSFSSLTDPLQVGLLSRNLYVRAMETCLHLVNQVANAPEPETPTETLKKLKKNSSK